MNDQEYVRLANSDAFVMDYLAWLGCKRPGPGNDFQLMSHPLERCPTQAKAFFETLSKKSQRPASEWDDYLIDEYLFMMGG
jgi:hypothetical protein